MANTFQTYDLGSPVGAMLDVYDRLQEKKRLEEERERQRRREDEADKKAEWQFQQLQGQIAKQQAQQALLAQIAGGTAPEDAAAQIFELGVNPALAGQAAQLGVLLAEKKDAPGVAAHTAAALPAHVPTNAEDFAALTGLDPALLPRALASASPQDENLLDAAIRAGKTPQEALALHPDYHAAAELSLRRQGLDGIAAAQLEATAPRPHSANYAPLTALMPKTNPVALSAGSRLVNPATGETIIPPVSEEKTDFMVVPSTSRVWDPATQRVVLDANKKTDGKSPATAQLEAAAATDPYAYESALAAMHKVNPEAFVSLVKPAMDKLDTAAVPLSVGAALSRSLKETLILTAKDGTLAHADAKSLTDRYFASLKTTGRALSQNADKEAVKKFEEERGHVFDRVAKSVEEYFTGEKTPEAFNAMLQTLDALENFYNTGFDQATQHHRKNLGATAAYFPGMKNAQGQTMDVTQRVEFLNAALNGYLNRTTQDIAAAEINAIQNPASPAAIPRDTPLNLNPALRAARPPAAPSAAPTPPAGETAAVPAAIGTQPEQGFHSDQQADIARYISDIAAAETDPVAKSRSYADAAERFNQAAASGNGGVILTDEVSNLLGKPGYVMARPATGGDVMWADTSGGEPKNYQQQRISVEALNHLMTELDDDGAAGEDLIQSVHYLPEGQGTIVKMLARENDNGDSRPVGNIILHISPAAQDAAQAWSADKKDPRTKKEFARTFANGVRFFYSQPPGEDNTLSMLLNRQKKLDDYLRAQTAELGAALMDPTP